MFCAFQPKKKRGDSGPGERKFDSVKFALSSPSVEEDASMYVCMYMYVCLYSCDEYMHVSLCINQCL